MVSAVRAPQVRQSNLALVLDLLRRLGPQSRSDLVARTGLTRSAIAGLVTELEVQRLVVEAPPSSDGSPGRPSPIVRIDDRHYGVFAIEVLVDEIGAAVVSLDGAVVHSIRRARGRRSSSLASTVRDVAGLVRRLDEQRRSPVLGGDERNIIGIGVSVPGLVRRADNAIVVAPNLGWVEADFARSLADVLEHDLPISIGNDAELGALAESRFGAGVGASHLLFVSGEVGVGGGLVVGGQPLAGHNGFAAEVGHLSVNPFGSGCRCGAVGCWETEIGEHALLRRAGLAEFGGRRSVDELLARAATGDTRVRAALDEEAKWLAIGLSGLINVFDPDRVVLGGLLGRVLPHLRERLDAELVGRRFQHVSRDVEVLGAALGEQSTTVGAAELAFGDLLRDPARTSPRGSGA